MGRCFAVAADGGPGGARPPVDFSLELTEGGAGTLLPLLYELLRLARAPPGEPEPEVPPPPPSVETTARVAAAAYVDPRDPSTIYLAEGPPVDRPVSAFPPAYPSW